MSGREAESMIAAPIGKPQPVDIENVDDWIRSDEFSCLCRAVNVRIIAGEAMTLEYVAEQIRLPWAAFAEWFGAVMSAKTGLPYIIDDEESRTN